MSTTKKCVLCNKSMIVNYRRIGAPRRPASDESAARGIKSHSFVRKTSRDGVYFQWKWICNDCWKLCFDIAKEKLKGEPN